MTGLLASVATLNEMEVVRRAGADIVDLKDPTRGALGAWDFPALEAAVARWRGWGDDAPLLSATIGDQPMISNVVSAAAERVAETGVPMVKLGLFAGGDVRACLAALKPLGKRTRLIAVFFADQAPELTVLDAVAAAGFHGAMLDTADKATGGLRRHLDDASIARFVGRARSLGLLTGLAGSLTLDEIPPMAALEPDYLGFRGALCTGGRSGVIEASAVASVRAAVRRSGPREERRAS